jgi:hypothetical protein
MPLDAMKRRDGLTLFQNLIHYIQTLVVHGTEQAHAYVSPVWVDSLGARPDLLVQHQIVGQQDRFQRLAESPKFRDQLLEV